MTSHHRIRLTALGPVLFCALFMLSGAVQPQERTVPPPTSDPNATKPQVLREYKQGELYALGDIVNLNADGTKLTVELVSPREGSETSRDSIEVKVRIDGKVLKLVFAYGPDKSNIALLVNQKRIVPSTHYFTEELVVTGPESTMALRARHKGKTGNTVVLDTNEHPLVFAFQVPGQSLTASKQLEFTDMSIGRKDYSLSFRLDQ